MYISDLIPVEEIGQWKPETPVIISAPTGAGKTHFIIHDLGMIARSQGEKILLLSNRIYNILQFRSDIEKEGMGDVIECQSYQWWDDRLKKQEKTKKHIEEYQYVVCDEYHYWLSDSEFNSRLWRSFEAVMGAKTIRIYMSATGYDIEAFIQLYLKPEKIFKYEMPHNWSFIKELVFFNSGDLNHILDDIEGKSLVFANNLDRLLDFHKRYEDSVFCCSKTTGHNAARKELDLDKLQRILQDGCFEEKYLFSTTAFDSGVNIWDDEVKNLIIFDIYDIGSIIQCIGRKRRKPGEQINLFVGVVGGRKLNFIRNCKTPLINECEYLIENGQTDYIKHYTQEDGLDSKIIRMRPDGSLTYNRFLYYRCKVDVWRINQIFKAGGWIEWISELFGCSGSFKKYDDLPLGKWLGSNTGKLFDKTTRKEVIAQIGLRDRDNRLIKGINTLNAYLKERRIEYKIEKVKKDRKVFWTIRKENEI